MSTPQAFIISRTFKAPLERVWKAWTEPEPMAQWWGPKGFKAAIKTLDLRPGGIFHYLLTSPQGQEMWGRFVYREVEPEKRLVYINSFSDEAAGLTRHPLHEGGRSSFSPSSPSPKKMARPLSPCAGSRTKPHKPNATSSPPATSPCKAVGPEPSIGSKRILPRPSVSKIPDRSQSERSVE